MLKKLGTIGLVVVIALLIVSSAVADLKFYGGDMVSNVFIQPTQNLVVEDLKAVGTQGLTDGDQMDIVTTDMYAVAADNQFLTRDVKGILGKSILDRQVTAAHNENIYKSSGLQTTAGEFMVKSFDSVTLMGKQGNIQFDAAGANPTLTFNKLSQENLYEVPADPAIPADPSMTQTSDVTAVLASPGESPEKPLSLITTGNAAGLVTIGSIIASSTLQEQEFSALLPGCAGAYNGQMQKADTINMSSVTQMGTM